MNQFSRDAQVAKMTDAEISEELDFLGGSNQGGMMCHAICDRIELLLSVRDARLESSEPDADSVDQATRLETVPVSMSDEDYSEWLDGEDDERADEDQVTAEIDDRAFAASCSMDRQSYSEWAR